MQLKQLEYVIKIAECGSITQAAEQLFVSQPSLTKSIMNLEQEYGVQLFVRKPRGIELTAEGRTFVHYARGVLTAASVLERNCTAPKESPHSRLFLVSQQLDFVYELFLQTYLANRDKSVHYNLIEADRNEVTRQVLDGEADLGLLVRSATDAKAFLWYTEARRLDIYLLDQAGVYAMVGSHSPFYDRKEITFVDAEHCMNIALDMESQAKQDLYFDNSEPHFNAHQMIFVNTIGACEHLLLHTDALLYVSKWTIGCFRNPALHVLRVVPAPGGSEPLPNELLWIKRSGELLNQTELQFLRLLYRRFGKALPENLR